MFNLERFINKKVIFRDTSMFAEDIEINRSKIEKKIDNKSVLVIGGAGSIGSSFIKAILCFKPSALVVVDTNENALAELTRSIRSVPGMHIPDDYVPYPMDFSSAIFEKMFRERKGFDIVANFSAHKHVRSEKDIYSIEALMRNNVLNIKGLMKLLAEYPPEEYFSVSTDKAANPVNIMGASKRLMEDLIFAYSDRFPVKTARFANVAFSNGSLPAGFLARIQAKQPISAPLDVKRYFVSPEESGHICMLACMLGDNREIFFPKLSEKQMMSFDIIAEELIKVHGYEVEKCASEDEAIKKAANLKRDDKKYPVFFSASNTAGEKPFEEFYTNTETIDLDRMKSLGVITGKGRPDWDALWSCMEKMEEAFGNSVTTKEMIVNILKEYMPNFNHIETGKSLDAKM